MGRARDIQTFDRHVVHTAQVDGREVRGTRVADAADGHEGANEAPGENNMIPGLESEPRELRVGAR